MPLESRDIEGDPWLHFFSTDKSNYVYDTRTNLIFPYEDPQHVRDRLDAFYRQKFGVGLDEVEINRIEYPLSKEEIKEKLDHELRELILNITEKCNFRCEYCIYSGKYKEYRTHSDKGMDLDVAKRAIDYFSEHSDHQDRIYIQFYGGEPFLEFEKIKELVKYTRDRNPNKEVMPGATTNGSLLTPEKFDWLADQKFSLLISLDGPSYIHDRNRRTMGGKPSYNLIMKNLRNLKREYPDYYHGSVLFNAVITDPLELGEIDSFFKEEPLVRKHQVEVNFVSPYNTTFPVKTLETLDPEEKEKFTSIIDNILKEYISFFKGENDKVGIAHGLFGSAIKSLSERPLSLVNGKIHPSGICIPGQRRLFVDTGGKFHPCERAENLQIGSINHGIEGSIDLLEQYINISQDCPQCWAINICPICYSLNNINGKLERRVDVCSQTKAHLHLGLILYTTLLEEGVEVNKFFGGEYKWRV